MDIIIVCHTEFGFVSDGFVIYDKKYKNGVSDGVKNLVELIEKYKGKVNFAVCPEVVDYFPKNINHEIGLHVHPGWQEFIFKGHKFFVGDEYLKVNCRQSVNSTALIDFPYEEQLEMIAKGREYISYAFGLSPKFFVAGRWSLNNNTVRALMESGITHDCSASDRSISDHYDWSELPRICAPYHPKNDDYQKRGDLPVLMVPISQVFPMGSVNPEIISKVGLSWLKACFLEYYRKDVPLFHICLHSPSMTDKFFISAMDDFINFISKYKNINFRFVSEIKDYSPKKYSGGISPYLFAINRRFMRSVLKKIF